MTEEEQKVKIAERLSTANLWMIMKRGLYYRPGAHGYTSDVRDAWKVSEQEADQHVYPHDEPVTKHRAPLPDYLHDFNIMHEVFRLLNWTMHTCDDGYRCQIYTSPQNGETLLADETGFELCPLMAKCFLKAHNDWKD